MKNECVCLGARSVLATCGSGAVYRWWSSYEGRVRNLCLHNLQRGGNEPNVAYGGLAGTYSLPSKTD